MTPTPRLALPSGEPSALPRWRRGCEHVRYQRAIGRPIEDVFAFVSDPLQFPRWNSAVKTVRITSGARGELNSTYSMGRELPTGRVENELEVFAGDERSEFGIRTTSGPSPFVCHYGSASKGADMLSHLDARIELADAGDSSASRIT